MLLCQRLVAHDQMDGLMDATHADGVGHPYGEQVTSPDFHGAELNHEWLDPYLIQRQVH